MSKKTGGKLLVVSAPSGTGKTTVTNCILDRFKGKIERAVTCTTRAPRNGEVDGVDYRFLTPEQFREKEAADGFLETKIIYENSYGTPKDGVQKLLDQGIHALLVIDVAGGIELMKKREYDMISIFLLPPSIEELERRIRSRGTESEKVIEERVGRAKWELEQQKHYHFAVVNDDLNTACSELTAIFEKAENE